MELLSKGALEGPMRGSGAVFQRKMNGLLGTRFELRPIGSPRFHGEILGSRLFRSMQLVDIRFTAHSTRLLPGRPKSDGRGSFLVSWQLEGNSVVRQGGRECEVEQGEIFILDTSRPFEIETDEIWTRSVHMDAAFLSNIFPELKHLTARTFDSRAGAGIVCAEMLRHLFENAATLPEMMASRLAEGLCHLLAIALLDSEEVAPAHASRPYQRLSTIKAFIRNNLSDPNLHCATISANVGISLRQMHLLFSAEGSSVMRWVWSERLRHIARDLENRALSHRTVSSIAFDWGFSEAAHFSRAFKSAYGVTPMSYRHQPAKDSS